MNRAFFARFHNGTRFAWLDRRRDELCPIFSDRLAHELTQAQAAGFARAEGSEGAERVVEGREAIAGGAREEAFDDRGESGIEAGAAREERFERIVEHGAQVAHSADPGPWTRAGEQFVEQHAHAELIGPRVEIVAANLFRRHVAELSLDQTRARPARSIARESDAEVAELHLALFGDQDVVRRDVSVDEVGQGALHGRQRAKQGARHVDGDAIGEQARVARTSGQRSQVESVDQLEHEKRRTPVVLADRQKRCDVFMAHSRQDPCFLPHRVGVLGRDEAGEALDAHLALQPRAVLAVEKGACAVHVAERASADARSQNVTDVGRQNLAHISSFDHRPPLVACGMVQALRVMIGSEPITRDVAARGARIRFVEAGGGGRPPLLLVHDYLSSRIAWDDVVPLLAPRFRVIAADLPGFGESEKPPPERYRYDFEAFGESLVDLLAAIGLGRVSVCGHAMGGAVALTVAANHAHIVDRLVLVNPLVYPTRPDLLSRIAETPLVGPIVFKQLVGRAFLRNRLLAQGRGGGNGAASRRVDHLAEVFDAPAAREAAFATMRAMLDTRPLMATVPRVTAPALVAWSRDNRASPVEYGRRLARELGGARFEVFDGERSPAEESPEAFARAVAAFIAGGKGGAR